MKSKNGKMPEITLKYKSGKTDKVTIQSSKDGANVLRTMYDADTLEYCESSIAIFLNRNSKTIGWMKVSQGGLNGTIIDKRIILATALKCGASGLIVSHNHPSGNTQPSSSDLRMTKSLKDACEIMEITLIDHIIITSDNYYSFADNGKL